jgi:hypothetical protein
VWGLGCLVVMRGASAYAAVVYVSGGGSLMRAMSPRVLVLKRPVRPTYLSISRVFC